MFARSLVASLLPGTRYLRRSCSVRCFALPLAVCRRLFCRNGRVPSAPIFTWRVPSAGCEQPRIVKKWCQWIVHVRCCQSAGEHLCALNTSWFLRRPIWCRIFSTESLTYSGTVGCHFRKTFFSSPSFIALPSARYVTMVVYLWRNCVITERSSVCRNFLYYFRSNTEGRNKKPLSALIRQHKHLCPLSCNVASSATEEEP